MDNIDFKTEGKNILKNIIMLIYLVITVLLSIIMAQGFDFVLDNINSYKFWAQVFINLIFVLLVYNICTSMILENIKRNIEGKYFAAYARFAKCVMYIRSKKLYDEVSRAVALYNEELKQQAYEKRLFNISDRLYYSDLKTYDIMANLYKLNKKELRKLEKLKQQYISGTLRYAKMKADYILRDGTLLPNMFNKSNLKFDRTQLRISLNILVLIAFIFISTLLNTILFKYGSESLMQTIVSQLFMFFSATFSAFWYSNIINNATVSNLKQKADWCQRFGFEET